MKILRELTEKTYLSTAIMAGFSKLLEDNTVFALNQKMLIKLFTRAVKEIYQEQRYKNEAPEIAYVLSSPSFRILLESSCDSNGNRDLGGYYHPNFNFLCLNLQGIFQVALNTEDFCYQLKELIRHEMHHAHKMIMHSAFPKRPEVFIPCFYHTDYDWPLGADYEDRTKKYTPYSALVRTNDFTQPIIPFTQIAQEKFIEALKSDLRHLNETLLVCPSALNQSLELQLVSTYYRPARWRTTIDNLETIYGLQTTQAIHRAVQSGRSYCIDIVFSSSFWPNRTLPLCVDKIDTSSNNVTLLSGHTVSNPKQEKSTALVWDMQWKINTVQHEYSITYHFSGGTLLEIDAWLFELPYPLYRAVFQNLNSMRIQEFNRFSQRRNEMSGCGDTADLTSLQNCLQQICSRDFAFISENFKSTFIVLRLALEYDVGCRNANDPNHCAIDYIKSSLQANASHPRFLETLNLSFMNNTLNELYIPLSTYYHNPAVHLFISPWYLILAASAFAFREELKALLLKSIFPAQPEKAGAFKQMKETHKEAIGIISDCTAMAVRLRATEASAVPGIVHDIVYHTKKHVQTYCKKNGFGVQTVCKAVTVGIVQSMAGLGWRYLAGPIITGAIAVKKEIKAGYQSNGILGALDQGLEAYADHFIPGAHTVLTNQKVLIARQEETLLTLFKSKQVGARGKSISARTTDPTISSSSNLKHRG